MIQPPLAAARWNRSGYWWVAAVVLLLTATALLFVGCSRSDEGPPATQQVTQPEPLPADGAGPAAPGVAGAPSAPGAQGAPSALGAPPAELPPGDPAEEPPQDPGAPSTNRSAPVSLRIPAIDVSTSLAELGLNPDNTVEVPSDFQQAGWFELGPTPGELGSSVVLGHVDSHRGPAVFFRLRSLRPGDGVEVSRSDGSVARFAVTSVETYAKERFPAERVYAPQGGSALNLVTCGGEFDREARSYRSNIVAYTSLVAVTPAPPA